MKIKLLTAIQTKILDRVPVELSFADVSFATEPTNDQSHGYHVKYSSEIKLYFQQIADAGANDQIRRYAVRALSDELYGDVRREITEVLKLLWQEGQHQKEYTKRLERMLPVLSGDER